MAIQHGLHLNLIQLLISLQQMIWKLISKWSCERSYSTVIQQVIKYFYTKGHLIQPTLKPHNQFKIEL